ncbi:unnamed protein product [Sphacelaria rigidula]
MTAKARLLARGFRQRFAVDYFETFAATPSIASTKLAVAVAVQEEWPLYHVDVTQAFLQAKMDTQAGRQGSRLLCQTLLEDVGMVQCDADPFVFKVGDAGDVQIIFVVHVDDVVISGAEENVRKVGKVLNDRSPTNDFGGVTWYIGCAADRDRDGGAVTQATFIYPLLKRFEMRGYSKIPASDSSKLGPTTGEDTVVNRLYRNAMGGLMWLATVTRPDVVNVVRALARQ